MTIITARERSSRRISDDVADALRASPDFAHAMESGILGMELCGSGFSLTTSCYVGQLTIDGVAINIEEKVAGSLSALLRYASHSAFRTEALEGEAVDLNRLFPLLVEQFSDAVNRYVSGGRKFSYGYNKGVGSLAGGKLLLTDTIRLRAQGLGHLLAFQRSQITHHIDPNRCILAALNMSERLADAYGVAAPVRSRIRGMSLIFSDCRDQGTLFGSRIELSRVADRLSRECGDASLKDSLSLASIILLRTSLYLDGMTSRGASPRTWFINLESLYEHSLRSALSDVASTNGIGIMGPSSVNSWIFPSQRRFSVNPDFVIDIGGTFVAGDAKYKQYGGSPQVSDIYQLLSHARAIDAVACFLAYASETTRVHYMGEAFGECPVYIFEVDVRNIENSAQVIVNAVVQVIGSPATLRETL